MILFQIVNALSSFIVSLSMAAYCAKQIGKASGVEFLESSHTGAPDCLVLDVHMPSVSGLDVQAALLDRGIHVPIIFITAFDDNAMRERALQQGAVAYLRKPLTEQTLLAAIATAVGPKHKHDQAPG